MPCRPDVTESYSLFPSSLFCSIFRPSVSDSHRQWSFWINLELHIMIRTDLLLSSEKPE